MNEKTILASTRLEVSEDAEEAFAAFYEKGYTDGLPIIPPTEKRVRRMVDYVRMDPGQTVAHLDPGGGAATVEKIAVNAVMAGCLPEYMPVLIAAVKALSDPPFNLHGLQCTTAPVAPMLIINGPIRKRIGLNCDRGVMGPGWRANATIGRAIRLILINIGGGAPGSVDQAIHGQPAKYSLLVGENEEESIWAPLHVDRGFRREESTVTVVSVNSVINNFTSYKKADSIIKMMAQSMCFIGSDLNGEGDVVIITPAHARLFAEQGYSKEKLKEALWKSAVLSRSQFPDEQFNVPRDRHWVWQGDKLTVARDPAGIILLVAGGREPYHTLYCPHWDSTHPITVPIAAGAEG